MWIFAGTFIAFAALLALAFEMPRSTAALGAIAYFMISKAS